MRQNNENKISICVVFLSIHRRTIYIQTDRPSNYLSNPKHQVLPFVNCIGMTAMGMVGGDFIAHTTHRYQKQFREHTS